MSDVIRRDFTSPVKTGPLSRGRATRTEAQKHRRPQPGGGAHCPLPSPSSEPTPQHSNCNSNTDRLQASSRSECPQQPRCVLFTNMETETQTFPSPRCLSTEPQPEAHLLISHLKSKQISKGGREDPVLPRWVFAPRACVLLRPPPDASLRGFSHTVWFVSTRNRILGHPSLRVGAQANCRLPALPQACCSAAVPRG